MKLNSKYIMEQFKLSSEIKLKFSKTYCKEIYDVSKFCSISLKKNKTIFFCGNGGSAADSQHLSAELVGKYLKDRKALKSISLNTNTSNITAIGNDFGYKYIFKRQLEALGSKDDILFCLSTSGNSENIIEVVKYAKSVGIKTIGFLGCGGGKLMNLVDFSFVVPSDSTPRIQETHITLGHIICDLIEKQLFL